MAYGECRGVLAEVDQALQLLDVRQSPVASRQAPATEPSVRPQAPLAKVLASDYAMGQVLKPRQSTSFSQINPVRLSVTVPSALSVNLGSTETPFCNSPS